MAVFVVTWNINREKSNYNSARAEFVKLLDTYSNVSDPGLESVRWIETDKSASDISQHLRTKLDDNDRIFISKVSPGARAGWLSKTVWDWIDKRA